MSVQSPREDESTTRYRSRLVGRRVVAVSEQGPSLLSKTGLVVYFDDGTELRLGASQLVSPYTGSGASG